MAWAELMRVDMLALFFTFTGLLLFLLAPRMRGLDYAAFLFFALAIFTKQTEIAAPAACLAIALGVDWRQAVRLGAFLFLLMGAGLACCRDPRRRITKPAALQCEPVQFNQHVGDCATEPVQRGASGCNCLGVPGDEFYKGHTTPERSEIPNHEMVAAGTAKPQGHRNRIRAYAVGVSGLVCERQEGLQLQLFHRVEPCLLPLIFVWR